MPANFAVPVDVRAAFRLIAIVTILAATFPVFPAASPASAQTLDRQYNISYLSSHELAAEVGTTFGGERMTVRVTRRDSSAAPVNGVSVTFTTFPASNGASGTFQTTGTGTASVTTARVTINDNFNDGVAIAPAYTANGTAGSYTVVATVDIDAANGVAFPITFSMTNTPSAANRAFRISQGEGSLQATLVNTTYPTPFYATVLNGSSQLLPGVRVTFTAPESGPSGVFSNGTRIATAVTNGNGVAVAPSFTANGIQGGYSVTASVSADQTASGQEIATTYSLRNSLTNVLGVPETVSQSLGTNQSVSVSTLVPTPLQVTVYDGSLDFVVGATVTWELPETGPSGLFTNGTRFYTTTTNAQGQATPLLFRTNTIVGPVNVTATATKDGVSRSVGMQVANGRVLTTTTLSLDPSNGSVYGQQVIVSARVIPHEGSLVPSGPVNFMRNGSPISGCQGVTPVGGVATCPQDWLEPGNYTFNANYIGDQYSQPSQSAVLNHTITKASTAIAFVSSHPVFAIQGESVTITATASPVPPGAAQAGEPTGTMLFTASDGTVLNDGNPVAVMNGVASVTTSDLSVGYITITAVYSGDGHFSGSSNTVVQNVFTVPEVTSDPADTLVLLGNQATFTAVADGFPEPAVQWQVSTNGVDFTDIAGADSTSYAFTPVAGDDQKQYRAVFTNAAGSDTTTPATLTVRQPPFFTSATSTVFEVGADGSFTVTADGLLAPMINLTSGTLPTGVNFDPATGALSGTPADETGGEYQLQFTATNGIEPDAVQDFTLYVNEAPAFTNEPSTTFVVGNDESFVFTASGYPAATFSTDGTLPGGVELSANGTLSGNPAEPGVFVFTVIASNGVDPVATQTFSLTVYIAPQITSSNATTFTVGTQGAFTVIATGDPAPSLSLDGELPGGVNFDPATGELRGTPADGTGGIYVVTVSATNVVGADSQTFTLTVNEAPEITSPNAVTFLVGEMGSFTVTAEGFPAAIISTTGDLPDGVTLDSLGVLSGVPSESGVFEIEVVASNGIGVPASQDFILTVNEASGFTSAATATFTVGTEGSHAVTVTGYPTPTVSVSGTLPSGVTFEPATGLLQGTPAKGTGGSYALTFTATNGVTADATQRFTLVIQEAPEITSADTVVFDLDQPGTFTVTADGYPAATFTSSGELPEGVSLSPDGVLGGIPSKGGEFVIQIVASNGIAPAATQMFTLTVLVPTIISPDDMSVPNDPGRAGAMVTYPAPATIGRVGDVSCTPAAGTFFAIGPTQVSCNASLSTAQATFTITVIDVEAPVIVVPADISVAPDSGSGAVVTYPAPTATDNVAVATLACDVPSGALIPVGVHVVTCTATDAARNSASATFTITVHDAAALLGDLSAQIDGLRINGTASTAASIRRNLLLLVGTVQTLEANNLDTLACVQVMRIDMEVRAQVSKRRIASADASRIYASTADIRAALGCGG